MITAKDAFLNKYNFIPENQDGEPTIFNLRCVSEDERTEIAFLDKDMAKAINYAISKCVLGWENFKNADGNEIEFSEKNKRMIPFDTRIEIFNEVIKNAKLSEAEIKN